MRDRRGQKQQSFIRINHKIRVSQVRCTGEKGEALGVMPTSEALSRARALGKDLVEISPNADPPVCKIMDYGQFRYQEGQKRRQTKKQQVNRSLKEIKFHANVGEHDYGTKLNHIRGFLEKGHKVRVSLTFRGRENAHRELGFEVIKRVVTDCEDLSVVDMDPRLMGRSIVCLLGVRSAKR